MNVLTEDEKESFGMSDRLFGLMNTSWINFYYIDFTNVHLQGSYLSEQYSFVEIKFVPCLDMNNQEDCASLIEVNDYFTYDFYVSFNTAENFVDFTDLDNPVQVNPSQSIKGTINTYEVNHIELNLA